MALPSLEQSIRTFDQLFYFSPQHHIVICKDHKYGCTQKQFKGHLDKKHDSLTSDVRKGLVSAGQSKRPWAYADTTIQYPQRDEAGSLPQPIPYLEIEKNSLECTQGCCKFVTCALSTMHQHQVDKHSWSNPRAGGRPPTTALAAVQDNRPWVTGVWSQKYQPTGRLGKRFAVSSSSSRQSALPVQRDFDLLLDSIDQQADRAMQEERERQLQQIDDPENNYEVSPWLQRTKWRLHLRGLDRAWLLALTKPSPADDPSLRLLLQLTRRVIWKAQQFCQSGKAGSPALFYVNRRETGSDTNDKPLNCRQTAKTMETYSGYWLSIVRYVWKTYTLPVHKPTKQATQPVAHKRPPYKCIDAQTRCLQALEEALDEAVLTQEDNSVQQSGEDSDAELEEEVDEEELGEEEREDNSEEDSNDDSEDEDEDDEAEERLSPAEKKVAHLEGLVRDLLLTLITHNLQDDEYKSPLVSAMAVLGIDKDGWLPPGSYTTKLSGIVSTAKMLMMLGVQARRQNTINYFVEAGKGSRQEAREEHSFISMLRPWVDNYLTIMDGDSGPSPMDFFLKLRAYGLKIHNSTNVAGEAEWVDNRVVYRSLSFTLQDFQNAILTQIGRARNHLLTNLLFLQLDDNQQCVPGTEPLPILPWDKLSDNPANTDLGFSFMSDERNQTAFSVGNPRLWLTHRLRTCPSLQQRFMHSLGQDLPSVVQPNQPVEVFKRAAVEDLLQDIRVFKEQLLVLIHITAGLPPRGTELLTLQYQNSIQGGQRSIFIEDGLVACVTRYHKGMGASQASKVIHRYLPPEVGELMVYFLWFAQPFSNYLELMLYPESRERVLGLSTAYIWPPKPQTRWNPPPVQLGDSRKRVQVSGPPAQNPSARHHAAFWTSQKISTLLKRYTSRDLGAGLTIAPYRHISIGIYRKYSIDKSTVATWDAANKDTNEVEDEAHDLQMGHTTLTAQGRYGRGLTEASFSLEGARAAFRKVSLEWHRILAIPSALQRQHNLQGQTYQSQHDSLAAAYNRIKIIASVSLPATLQNLLRNPDATFRGKQEEALMAIQVRRDNPVVAVLGTAAGKSMLFMLPAFCSAGVTVVVVPLLSLRDDMMRRCKDLGISSLAWSATTPYRMAQIVLITPEGANKPTFRAFLNSVRSQGLLDRIVVDEAHVILDSVGGWRNTFHDLYALFYMEVQMVFLTATLPPKVVPQIRYMYHLPPSTVWIRDSTVRSNHAYQVQLYENRTEAAEAALRTLVSQLQAEHAGRGKIIVFCSTREQTKDVATALGCPCFHAEVGTDEEKRTLAEHLVTGQETVFSATSAWGLGIDDPHVRAVVSFGLQRNTIAWLQAAGRAGRDGQQSDIVLMQPARLVRQQGLVAQINPLMAPELQELVQGSICARVVIDRFADGDTTRTSCSPAEAPCWVCRSHTPSSPSNSSVASGDDSALLVEDAIAWQASLVQPQQVARQVRTAEMQAHADIDYCVRTLQEWDKGCFGCLEAKQQCDRPRQCYQLPDYEMENMANWIQHRNVRYDAYTCCYDCGLPQAHCAKWEEKDDGGWEVQDDKDCQIRNKRLLSTALISLWTKAAIPELNDKEPIENALRRAARRITEGEFEGTFDASIAEKRWLGAKRRFGGVECSNLFFFVVKLMGAWRDG